MGVEHLPTMQKTLGASVTRTKEKEQKIMKSDKPGQLKAQLPLGLSSRTAFDQNL